MVMSVHSNHTNTNANGGPRLPASRRSSSGIGGPGGDWNANYNAAMHIGNNSRPTIVSEGWLELFLTPSEKNAVSHWTEVVRDKSLVSKAGNDSFRHIANFVPNTVSPNLLTLTGLVMLVQAWYAVHTYGQVLPVACTWLAAANICIFFVLNSITYHHADRIRQHTALADLFKYSCDSGSTVFLALLLAYCFGATTEAQWHLVQACQLVLFLKHLSAFRRHAGLRYRVLAGPGEVLVCCVVLLAVRAVVGLETLQTMYRQAGQAIASNITMATEAAIVATAASAAKAKSDADAKLLYYATAATTEAAGNRIVAFSDKFFLLSGGEVIRLSYYLLFAAAVANSAMLPKKHGWTRFGLLVSLLMRLVPALLLLQAPGMENHQVTVMDVICDGLFMAVLTSDLSLAKMANRELHQTVVLMSLAAVLSYGVILTLVAVYFIGVFSDLCFYLNLPILAVARNVYCDGVYDLCHIGHKRAFQNALRLGNRLFVGVVGDEDASHYKRPPIMTHAERCAEVEACKAVTKVIPNAPCFGLTQEFLDEHQIHVVAFGEEYLERWPNPDDDPYYGYVRKIGIAQPLPRTNALSTTELIERIQKAKIEKKKSPT